MVEHPSEPYGENRQRDIYSMGMLADSPPDLPVRYEELRDAAVAALDGPAADYVAGGAGNDEVMVENRRAFERWRVLPHHLRDVSGRDLSTRLLGREWPVPMMLAPIGVQSLFHADGELATARAAADLDVPMCLSSVSSATMEDVADALGDTPKWFQLYWSSDRAVTESFVERAERAGYDAIVVTVDVPFAGWRERDLSRGYIPFLDGEGLGNYFADPAFRDALSHPPEENEDAAITHFLDIFGNPGLTFDDIADLAGMTDLPVVVKGLLDPDDAVAAAEAGAEVVGVSNHGGRQLAGAVGALDALPAVVEALDGRAAVTLDSGVRRGSDIFRALALGADAVMLGRPYVYGLALGGQAGVTEAVSNVRADFDITMANAGTPRLADVDRSRLVEAPWAVR